MCCTMMAPSTVEFLAGSMVAGSEAMLTRRSKVLPPLALPEPVSAGVLLPPPEQPASRPSDMAPASVRDRSFLLFFIS